jgi:hypothetical protein
MIPPVFDESTPSPGERLLFDRLRRDPGTDDWVVLHSLDLAEHPSQVCGEVDFVVVVPGLGVLCLEVKAHRRVSRDASGRWILGNRPPTQRSPFRQADDQMRSIMKFLRDAHPDLARVPVLSAVWFTNCRADLPPSIEWHPWQLLDRSDLGASVADTLSEVLARGRRHLTEKTATDPGPGPDRAACDRVVRALRPEFELAVSAESMRSQRARHLLKFTEEQYDALDTMHRSPRVLFTGPAGTGKTFLTLEAARRASQQGRSVLLVCYNRLLAGWLRTVAPDGITVITLHALMCRAAGVQPPGQAPPGWWSDELPNLAIDALLEDTSPPADVLVVDEAQDLAAPAYLDVLDLSVAGGLAAGTWTMFGDFERQAIFGQASGSEAVLARAADAVHGTLARNCRNTPRVGSMAATLARLSPGYRGFRRPDDGLNVVFRPYASKPDQEHLLMTQLKRLAEDGFSPDDVVVLSASASGAAAASRDPALRSRLCQLSSPVPGQTRYGTVHTFKGLDAPAVIVTDIDSLADQAAVDLLYIAMTRSTGPLCLFVDKRISHELTDLVLQGGSSA